MKAWFGEDWKKRFGIAEDLIEEQREDSRKLRIAKLRKKYVVHWNSADVV